MHSLDSHNDQTPGLSHAQNMSGDDSTDPIYLEVVMLATSSSTRSTDSLVHSTPRSRPPLNSDLKGDRPPSTASYLSAASIQGPDRDTVDPCDEGNYWTIQDSIPPSPTHYRVYADPPFSSGRRESHDQQYRGNPNRDGERRALMTSDSTAERSDTTSSTSSGKFGKYLAPTALLVTSLGAFGISAVLLYQYLVEPDCMAKSIDEMSPIPTFSSFVATGVPPREMGSPTAYWRFVPAGLSSPHLLSVPPEENVRDGVVALHNSSILVFPQGLVVLHQGFYFIHFSLTATNTECGTAGEQMRVSLEKMYISGLESTHLESTQVLTSVHTWCRSCKETTTISHGGVFHLHPGTLVHWSVSNPRNVGDLNFLCMFMLEDGL